MTSRTRNHPQPTRRTLLRGAVVAALAATTAGVSAAQAAAWPTEFPLPDGFIPEGITIGHRPYAYMGSRANGAVYRTDLRTGKGRVIHKGTTGTVAVGLKLDEDGLLYISGGGAGTARVVYRAAAPERSAACGSVATGYRRPTSTTPTASSAPSTAEG